MLGLTTMALVAILLLIGVAIFAGGKQKGRRFTTIQLTFSAIAIALAFVTSNIKLFYMPMGGSVTLLSMMFICLIGYWYGPYAGFTTAIAYGILQMIVDPYILSVPQLLIDYILAFGALGLAGFGHGKKFGFHWGYLLAVFGRFVFAVISGVVFFASYAPETMSPLAYSAAYNAAYLAPEALLTLAIVSIPAVRKALDQVEHMATVSTLETKNASA